MANHVYFNIEVTSALTEGQWNESFHQENVERKVWDDKDPYIVREFKELENQPFMQHLNPKFDEEGHLTDSWNWYVSNVGAKWCHVEDCIYDEDTQTLSGYSAWSAPIDMCNAIVHHIQDTYDEAAHLKMTFEDEFRNFIGIYHIESHRDTDGEWISNYDEDYVDDGDIAYYMEEVFGDVYHQDDFDWHDEHENLRTGEMVIPQEHLDEMVYAFFENCTFGHVD